MLESIFSFLFKYRPLLFDEGRIVLAPPVPWPVLALLALVAAALAAAVYVRVPGKASPSDRATLTLLRVGAIVIVAFCLMRPLLVVSAVVPQQNHLAVLIDDSRSMALADGDGAARQERVLQAFADPGSPVLRALADRFQLRFYGFGSDARRVGDAGELTFAATATRIGPSLDRVRQDLSSVPLSGVILVTDGADAPGAALAETLLALRAAEVPVYTVAVGRDAFDRDIEVVRANAPRSALKGSSLVVDVTVTHRGYGGRTVPLQVEDEGRIVALEEITLPRDGGPVTARVRFTLDEPGARRISFRVPPLENERVPENNARSALVHVRDGRDKILYFEGEPRFEVKFLRRAVADDENLQLVVLQRTAEGKFLRLDVDDGDELLAGFPTTRDELFGYRALVLGSIEASFFSHDQLRMIQEFVSRRGGGLLMLGGRRAFAEGGWGGTPVADALPVVLGEGVRDTLFYGELKVEPTRDGAAHFVTQVAADERASAERWRTLPAVTAYNRVGRLKPGATALLNGAGSEFPGGQVVLAQQRYGRGQSMAFPVHDSWLWQMHADVPLEDRTHETFWRQMLRWLVADAPGRVTVTLPTGETAPGEPVRVAALVEDASYSPVSGARVVAEVTSPIGELFTVPLDWSVGRPGEYSATFTPAIDGLYEVRVAAEHEAVTTPADPAFFRSGASDAEFFDAQLRAPLLRRIAQETGGRHYTIDAIGTLPEDIGYTGRGVRQVEEKELFDMPILFFMLVGLLGGEWLFRRSRGLA